MCLRARSTLNVTKRHEGDEGPAHEATFVSFVWTPPNGIRVPSLPALPLQLNGLHNPSYQEAASTTKQIPYHSCSQTEVNSSAFSTAEAQRMGPGGEADSLPFISFTQCSP